MNRLYIGSHVSTRKGYTGAAKAALSIGASAYQYFPKNPRGLTVKAYDAADAEACAAFCRQEGIRSIAHAPYPANIAIGDPDFRSKLLPSLKNDLEITDRCGSVGLVVHFGKGKGGDPLGSYRNMLGNLNELLAEYDGKALILLENLAGEGTFMGTTFEEMVQIRKLAERPDRIGFCFDTCHGFASGLWNGRNWPELLKNGTELGYFEQVKAVHLNDSRYPAGACKDRHANIGKGYIGEAGFTSFFQSPFLQGIPIVLETPAWADYGHKEEIEAVKRMINQ